MALKLNKLLPQKISHTYTKQEQNVTINIRNVCKNRKQEILMNIKIMATKLT